MGLSAWVWRIVERQERCERAARERERQRVARDLHDGLSQDIYATSLELTLLQQRVPAELKPSVARLIDRQVDMIEAVRQVTRPSAAGHHHLNTGALLLELKQLADREPSSTATVYDRTTSKRPVSRLITHHAPLALREMLSNAIRHSGASEISVQIEADDETLTLTVIDNGLGFDGTPSTGNGLTNLRQRSRQCLGAFTLQSTPGGRTAVRWSVPWTAAPVTVGSERRLSVR